MLYKNITFGKFIDRPNRFIAHVLISNTIETVHVKNTGRCRELLIPGVEVILEKSDNSNRKTKYDLVTVWKEGIGWINIDSQAPNKIAYEYLQTLNFDYIKPEFTYQNSRIDFYMEKNNQKYLMEIKGCTLEKEGIGYFPDAPTLRGVKHLKELTKATLEGFKCSVGFVIQMNNIEEVRANIETHPEFGDALENAKANGVNVIFICCTVTENEVVWKKVIETKKEHFHQMLL